MTGDKGPGKEEKEKNVEKLTDEELGEVAGGTQPPIPVCLPPIPVCVPAQQLPPPPKPCSPAPSPPMPCKPALPQW